jgi:hypothetical protein
MSNIVEEYKDITDYEDTYQISNFGNVRNKNTGRILKPTEGKTDKYYYITLCKDGKQKIQKYIDWLPHTLLKIQKINHMFTT